MCPAFIWGFKMTYQFKDVFCDGKGFGNHTVFLFEARDEIERLEKKVIENAHFIMRQMEMIEALNRDYRAACKQRDSWKTQLDAALNVQNLDSESHDELIALRAQVLAFFTVSVLFKRGIVTIEEVQKVFAELQRLAVE